MFNILKKNFINNSYTSILRYRKKKNNLINPLHQDESNNLLLLYY